MDTETLDKLFLELSQFTKAKTAREIELENLVEQLCNDLNQTHDELLGAKGNPNPSELDWPGWTPQANSVRWAERLLGKKLAKTDAWTMFPGGGEVE